MAAPPHCSFLSFLLSSTCQHQHFTFLTLAHLTHTWLEERLSMNAQTKGCSETNISWQTWLFEGAQAHTTPYL